MIKFFRKIRERILSENKPTSPVTGGQSLAPPLEPVMAARGWRRYAGRFSKYLIYAIGEIVLVVLGILIALQVNNLNEQRKANEFEVKILNEIRSNLQMDLIEIREDLEVMDCVLWLEHTPLLQEGDIIAKRKKGT